MRIISQDGMMDFPYELCAVYISKNPDSISKLKPNDYLVLCRWQADQKSANILAEYQSEDNAKKAMQMLHDAFNDRDFELADGRFTHYDCIFKFPSNREMEDGGVTNGEYAQILAQKLNGIEYGVIPSDMVDYAKEHGLVVVTGCSDDLIEFDGAIIDEDGCFDGGHSHFDKTGFTDDGKNHIDIIWCGKIKDEPAGNPEEFQTPTGTMITWCYKTDIPHFTFMMYEDDEPYCRGIVFSIEDVK